ncbi:SpoIIE family protein phosphatase [Cryptosporangium aurantiacum]|uniref:histidine kinase n=1 Tax=Cryptosporangium aurantiacum TaxID=134849 RepID=A0A1M7H672_9ACTN|nr:SpoIIE family protein phosphatase [Cryptosporangium aurantiacum]SHM24091.1 PAS/PAC sensor hybrid histidine kinase [Cryptosporangium aurantiacum]
MSSNRASPSAAGPDDPGARSDDPEPDGDTPDDTTPDDTTPDDTTPDSHTPDGDTPDGPERDGPERDGPEHGASTPDVFAADDEIGADLADVDWSATPLGPPTGWPQSLRTAVSILLSSRFPMWMAWGPELTFFCNAAYRRDTLGRKYPWALGRPASEVWAEIWNDIGPRIDTVLTTGKATWDEALLLFVERSGFPEESYHTFSYSPLRDDAGALVGMLCVVSEDTERVIGERRMATLRDLGSDPSVVRTVQETLAFSSRQLARNLRDLPFTLVYLFTDDAHAELAAASGIPSGHPMAPRTLAADGANHVWPTAALARQETLLVPLDAETPSGDWPEPPTHALLVPLIRQGAAPHGFLVAALNRYRPYDEGYRGFIELTATHVASGIASARSYQAQQRRAEELAELDRAKTAFFSNVSHEFRTPLTLITGPLQELRDRLPADDQRSRDDVEMIHRNGLRLTKLVNTLLDFSRIEAGRMQARYEPIDLALFTAELASVFRAAVERAGLTFDVDCPRLDQPVYLDRGMWEKIVLNLLSNALKFTFDGAIRVSVAQGEAGAVVRVADSGIGVPAAEMPRLFERFHRIPTTRSRSNEGSGIGLALVQELVALHGGTIGAESDPGVGTTFTIRLPFGSAHLPAEHLTPTTGADAPTDAAEPFVQEALRWLPEGSDGTTDSATNSTAEPTPVVPSPAGSDVPRGRVLVADDNADMRDYLERLLSSRYAVTTVADGVAALASARSEPPDLIVSDVMMPSLDGLELVTALRADPRTAGIPIVLLSARAGQEAAVEGLSAGADDYLVKPFAAQELLARVRANVDLARLRNHHAQWRTALIDSLQEGFFVADADGSVVEVNSAFSEILGYPAEDLPYPAPQPWWPDPQDDPAAHGQVLEAYRRVLDGPYGDLIVPLQHRKGHRLWAAVSISSVNDDRGARMVVGTIRDVTAERYAAQRDAALNAMNERLAVARTVPEVLQAGVEQLRRQWQATAAFARSDTVTAAVPGGDRPPAALDDLRGPGASRIRIDATEGRPTGVGATIDSTSGPVALWLVLNPARGFGTEDQTLLLLLCGSLSQALHRAYAFDQQRDVAVALQRSILGPAVLPDGFAVRYQPAGRPLEVGGDWYDAVELPDGRIGIMVGDCVGRGLVAATVMGQLRSAGRALLLQASGPAEVLTSLDRFAALLPGASCTTAFCGILDAESGRLVYSSAGHPPGILAHPDGRTELLDGGRGTPLGVRRRLPRTEAVTMLPARAVTLLYTDGLVERRGRSIDLGIGRAADTLRNHRTLPVEDLAEQLLSRMAAVDGGSDDVALLLYGHPAPLDLCFDADAGELVRVRAALRRWLARAGVGQATTQSVLVAAGEACANAIEHGYRDASGLVRLVARAGGQQLDVTVTDAGTWRDEQTPPDPHRGHGLHLIRSLMGEVTLHTGATGTVVEMVTRITP